jgi:mannose-6-phosphate isomerase-like protein (cupin superfamily)
MLPVYNSHGRLTIGTEEATVVATSSETNGALFAIHLRMHPGGGPPVMHRHDPGEVYYVIEGEFTFYVQDVDGHVQRRTAKTGGTVPLAGGTPHTVRNESASDAVAFVVHAPGPPMEGFPACRRRIGRLRRGRHGTRAGHRRSARHRTAWPDPIHP